MAKFAYRARNIAGLAVEGVLEADSDRAVSAHLAGEGLFPVLIRAEAAATSRDGAAKMPRRADVNQFIMELSELLEAGVPMLDAMRSIRSHAPRREMRAMLESFDTGLAEGGTLSAAMAAYPRVFSDVEVSLVRAAEKGGFLAKVLARMGSQREYFAEARGAVLTALAYPSVLVVVLISVVTVLLTFVVPKFEAIFLDMGSQLPLPTLILISGSNLIITYWYAIVLAFVAAAVTVVNLASREKWKRRLGDAALETPLVSDVIVRFAASRFARSLELMLDGGVPMSDALGMAGATTGLYRFRTEIDAALVKVRDGSGLAEALRGVRFLNASHIEMIAVAEKAGDLGGALGRIAEKADKATNSAIKRALAIFEPALIVAMAVVVGYVVLSLLVPIFTLSAAVR